MNAKRLEQGILRTVRDANRAFGLIAPGDRIMVAMSGGKDSYCLAWALHQLRAASHFNFEMVLFHLDQGQPGHDVTPLRQHMQGTGYPFEIELQDTYTRVVEKTEQGKSYCSLCSRFRRAILYKAAKRHGCNKLALGHHREDLIETLLLNVFFSGQLKSMPPKLISEQGPEQLIRPLAWVAEADCAALAQLHDFPIMPCQLCGSQASQRAFVKNLLGELSERFVHIKGNMLAALGNVVPSHLLDPRHNPLLGVTDPLVHLAAADKLTAKSTAADHLGQSHPQQAEHSALAPLAGHIGAPLAGNDDDDSDDSSALAEPAVAAYGRSRLSVCL